MDRPSQREVLTNQYICPNCGSNQSHRIDENHKADCLNRLVDRLETIENLLGIMVDRY
nr:MAG TPA: co-chaperone HscB [Caudoviricetes sp.]